MWFLVRDVESMNSSGSYKPFFKNILVKKLRQYNTNIYVCILTLKAAAEKTRPRLALPLAARLGSATDGGASGSAALGGLWGRSMANLSKNGSLLSSSSS